MTGTTNTAAAGQCHQHASAEQGLLGRCRDFVTEQSAGEWDDKTIANDADKLMAFVSIEVARACNAHDELLEALKRIVTAYDLPGHWQDEVAQAMGQARAAIACAEGR